jgi:hypothetical protein
LGENTTWLLATDNEGTRARAKEKFGDRVIYNNATISRANEEGLESGIIEIWLLSECEDIIVSAASTFSRVAYGLKGQPPMVINRRNQCFRKRTSQPCFFKWNSHRNQCFDSEMIIQLSPMWRNEISLDCDNT